MEARITDGGALALELASNDEAESFFAEAGETRGFYLQLDRQTEFFQRFEVRASSPEGFAFAFAAQVVQVHPVSGGFGTAFELRDWDEAKEKELAAALRGEARELSEAERSPIFRIKKMNPSERFILATKASRVERQILARDSNPQVLLGLLQHPRLEPKEVVGILKSHFVTGSIMEYVTRNRKWMQHPEIPALIAKNPKAPQPLAIQLLDLLRTRDLRQMARSSGLREGVKKAALKLYLKRTGK